jgi:hypothetical protein
MKESKTPTATRDALLDKIFEQDWHDQHKNDLVPKLQQLARASALYARVQLMPLWSALMGTNDQGDYAVMNATDLATVIGEGTAAEKGLGCPATSNELYLQALEQWPGGDSSKEMSLAQDE